MRANAHAKQKVPAGRRAVAADKQLVGRVVTRNFDAAVIEENGRTHLFYICVVTLTLFRRVGALQATIFLTEDA